MLLCVSNHGMKNLDSALYKLPDGYSWFVNKMFTRSNIAGKCRFWLDKEGRACYTDSRKTKQAGRIRLTSSPGRRGSQRFQAAREGGLLLRGCQTVSAFCDFRTEVFRPLVNKCMN